MGLTKRQDGYYVEFSVLDNGKVLTLARNVPGAKLKRWKVGSLNKTVAKQHEALIKADLLKEALKSQRTKRLSFTEWGNKYLELEEIKSLRSYKERVHALTLQLTPFFGHRLLEDILPEDIEAYRTQRKLRNGSRPSLATLNNDHTILKHVFSVAERRGLLVSNPAKKVPIPEANNERDRILTSEEWGRLYHTAAAHLKPILLIAYQLGPRLGEILGLTWDRVDLQRGFLKFRSADTKTKEARMVPLTAETRQCLMQLSTVRRLTTNRVFLYKGKPIKEIKSAFKTALKRAGITDFRFHDLRHCAATSLRRAGIDTLTAMQIIGHKSEKMYRRYNSINEDDLLHAAAKINTVITPANSPVSSAALSC